jgi:hypothetical protein
VRGSGWRAPDCVIQRACSEMLPKVVTANFNYEPFKHLRHEHQNTLLFSDIVHQFQAIVQVLEPRRGTDRFEIR